MAKIRLATTDLVDNSAAIVATTEDTVYPITNVKNIQLSNVWRSTDLTTQNIDIQVGTSGYDTIALLGTNLSNTATWQITAGATQGATTFDSGVLNFWPNSTILDNWNSKPGFYKFTTTQTHDWVRIQIIDGSNLDGYIEVGKLIIDKAWTPTFNTPYNWSIEWVDPSLVNKSFGGRVFITKREPYRILKFDLNWLSETEMFANAFELDRLKGKSKEVLVIRDIDDTLQRHNQYVYGLFQSLAPIINTNFNIFKKRYVVEEIL